MELVGAWLDLVGLGCSWLWLAKVGWNLGGVGLSLVGVGGSWAEFVTVRKCWLKFR